MSLDLDKKYYFQQLSSGWVLAGLPNLEIKIMRMRGVPIGAGIQLPNHVKKSRTIVCWTHDVHRRDFNNNLCFFQCLALHFGATTHALEGVTHHVKERVEEYAGKSLDGVREVGYLSLKNISIAPSMFTRWKRIKRQR